MKRLSSFSGFSDYSAVLLLWLLALLPRVSLPGEFITVDEAYHWFDRSERFIAALQAGAYAETNIIGHPGVTTLWLGAGGVWLVDLLTAAGGLPVDLTPEPYWLLRLPVAVITALTVGLAFPLLRRLFGVPIAWAAALLWAADPLLVAHSKLLHVDALLTSFMLLCLLCLLVGLLPGEGRPGIAWGLVGLSGAVGGLALLTKSPSVLLVPLVGLFWIVRVWFVGWPNQTRPSGYLARLQLIAAGCLLWGTVAGLVWVALWPAAWVDLPGALQRVFVQVAYEGAEPHGWGNFFLGRPVDDPGPLFYPVALLLRLPPWTLLGLVVLLVPARPLAGDNTGQFQHERWAVVALLTFGLLFLLMMSVPPKKFDRYLLPLIPALCILAAIGWGRLWRRWWPQRTALVPLLLAPLSLATLLWYHPYEIAYYNPLLGGGATAARLLPVGWGEGLEQAGAYITQQPNGCGRPVATWYRPVLEPFLCSPVVGLPEVTRQWRVDYAVLYLDQVQRNNAPQMTRLLQQEPPVHTVVIHGIPYAWVYQVPLALDNETGARFGADQALTLHSYQLAPPNLTASQSLTLTVQWQAQAEIERDYLLFVHLLDATGQRVAQIDVPPAGPDVPTSQWRSGHYYTWFHPLPLPVELPLGDYWLVLGLYDPVTGSRLPLEQVRRASDPDFPDYQTDVWLIGPLERR